MNFKDARDQVAVILGAMTQDNGCSFTLPPANINTSFSKKAYESKDPASYPKAFIMVDGGDIQQLPGNQGEQNISFLMMLMMREGLGTPDVQASIENAIVDFIRVFTANYSLNGSATWARITHFATDAGTLHPEGVVVFRLDVQLIS